MSLRDFALFVLICAIWAMNIVVTKIVVTDMGVPPLFFAALRSAVIAIAVLPWLFPMPRPRWRIVAVSLLMGGGGFALFFVGLRTASPSAAGIVSQLGVPMVTLLSALILNERVRWRRGLGIALTVLGVIVVMWQPEGFDASFGLLFIAGSAFGGALGAVMMKQLEGIRPLRLQAWVGFASTLLLAPISAGLESNQLAAAAAVGWAFAGIVLYSALIVSVFAHTAYYGLIQRYEANLVAPLTVMSPLFAIGFGVWLTDDPFGLRMAVGSAIALFGVLIIAVRPNQAMPRAVAISNAPD